MFLDKLKGMGSRYFLRWNRTNSDQSEQLGIISLEAHLSEYNISAKYNQTPRASNPNLKNLSS